MRDYFDTEQLIQRSGLQSLIFRNALYLDPLPDYFGGAQVFEGGIHAPAGKSTVAYALRREMGEAVANAIIDGDTRSQTFVLSAPRAYSMTDMRDGQLNEASCDLGTLLGRRPASLTEGLREVFAPTEAA